jgi:hypothetical protein
MRKTALALVLFANTALADDAADTATARALGIEGVTLADAGKCKEAIEKLERAEKLHHAPTTATRLAECEIETGKLVRGTERLQRVVHERLPPNAPPVFVAATTRASTLLAATLPRIATLRISVSPAPASEISLTIDDEPASDAILDSDRHIDPGVHEIKVHAPGFMPETHSATLAEGETKSLIIELRRDAGTPLPHATHDDEPSKVPAILAFGIGAAGLGVGVYAATVADQKSKILEQRCDPNHVCAPELHPALDEAKKWATISTVGFITAGAGVTTAVVLLLLSGSKKQPAVRPAIGATSFGVDGVF